MSEISFTGASPTEVLVMFYDRLIRCFENVPNGKAKEIKEIIEEIEKARDLLGDPLFYTRYFQEVPGVFYIFSSTRMEKHCRFIEYNIMQLFAIFYEISFYSYSDLLYQLGKIGVHPVMVEFNMMGIVPNFCSEWAEKCWETIDMLKIG